LGNFLLMDKKSNEVQDAKKRFLNDKA